MTGRLRVVGPDQALRERNSPVDAKTLEEAAIIVEDVRGRGEAAIRDHGERFGDLNPGEPVVIDSERLGDALAELDSHERTLLDRTTGRIRAFAEEQRSCLLDLDVTIPGGRAGHRWLPVKTTGAYAPGGRHPLPSSVLMTVIPARVAGVATIWVASPRPTPITLAAAAISGADGLLAIGGAQAIAALAFGVLSPACDLVIGPGNRWVTAAKKYLFGEVGIDGLAGPSEIVIIADATADASRVASDLLAQAEHDPDALPILMTDSRQVIRDVEKALADQLASLPTQGVASSALEGGAAILVDDMDQAVELGDRLAPEHLALHVADAEEMAVRLSAYGSLFVGAKSAEVFADYGAGPNHVLPTGRGARFQSGLSVATFLRASTWITMSDPDVIAKDAADLARLEGLEAHARAAELRM
ncbi:MAG: histidinol dehydrogenase [Acidobacteria bacterium]|nr:histidinol dehydrogenase [Acidobacteriota bacterium]